MAKMSVPNEVAEETELHLDASRAMLIARKAIVDKGIPEYLISLEVVAGFAWAILSKMHRVEDVKKESLELSRNAKRALALASIAIYNCYPHHHVVPDAQVTLAGAILAKMK